MCPVAVVGCLVEAHAIGARSGSHPTGFLISVKLKIANEIGGIIVKAREMVGGWLLQRNCSG